MGLWAVVPVKERDRAKERLAPLLPPGLRQGLVSAMLEDVLAAVAGAAGLSGHIVVTVDPAGRQLALRYGARIVEDGARDGHTGAVTAAARLLAAEGCSGMLTVPGDIPLVTAEEIGQIIAAHAPAPSFTIVPSHDEGGSNAILLSPPDAVPLAVWRRQLFSASRAPREQQASRRRSCACPAWHSISTIPRIWQSSCASRADPHPRVSCRECYADGPADRAGAPLGES